MPDLADLFPGFASHFIDTDAGKIFARSGGAGPPLVLVHGFPQTHVAWHRVAPALARRFSLVIMDMRGYGWSAAPRGDGGRETYAKRTMAHDVVQAMETLGHVRFSFAGHDRGARIGYRLALDSPGRVEKLVLLDILPTFQVWKEIEAGTSAAAHWEFLARPEPVPETELSRDPLPYFEGLLAKWSRSGDLGAFDPRALDHYRAGCNEPNRVHAFCEDYRAGKSSDRAHDEADLAAGKQTACPLLLVWGRHYLGRGGADPLAAWHASFAPNATGISLDTGHFLGEEAPEETADAMLEFLTRRP